MTRRLLATYLSLAVVVLAALEIPLGLTNARSERRNVTQKVERDAVAVASLAESTVEGDRTASPGAIATLAQQYAHDTGARLVIVNKAGDALADSSPPGPGRRNFASRPEFAAALQGNVATGTRHSTTLRSSFLYVAVPIASGGKILGAVRITYPTSTLDARTRRYWLVLAVIAAIVLAAAGLLGASFARWIRKPLADLESAAAAVSDGDLAARATLPDRPPELRALTGSFNEMVAKLEALVASQRDFVADASHELRTPLTALGLRLENLESQVGAGGRKGLEAALSEVSRLSGIIESLLALARADAGTSPAEAVDLADVARERTQTWQPVAQELGVVLRLAAERQTPARAGRDRLGQVLDNLVRNALAAAPRGSTVEVEVEPAGPALLVRDEGPGMSAEEKRRAFDRFWRGRATGSGSGLGLAIARRLVEADGGTIELRDSPSGGLEAVVRLQGPDKP